MHRNRTVRNHNDTLAIGMNLVSGTTSNRIWATLSETEAAAVVRAAEARGVRPSDLVRQAVLAFIAHPVPADRGPGAGLGPLMAQQAEMLALLRRLAEESEDVRSGLDDIAHCVGVIAGSIVPVDADPDDGGRAQFGP